MKALLISDHAKWCALMMNGKKTIEVRKGTALYKATQKLIDEYGYAKFYVYCSMAKHIKDYLQIENGKYVCNVPKDYESELNGKVVFKFRCYKVEEIRPNIFALSGLSNAKYFIYRGEHSVNENVLTKLSCLSSTELDNYLKGNNGCAIHISDLEIFDKPKELSEFDKCILCEDLSHDNIIHIHQRFKITKAPQSFMFIEVE